MSAVTMAAPPLKPGADEGRIGARANLRHIGALVRRNVLQIKQDPALMFDALLMPVIFILLFVYVFGGAIAGKGRQGDYVQYLVPGMMGMMAMNIATAVGTGVNEDFRKGVMDRFRTMPIARSSVLIAKIVVELGRMLIATTILLAMGFLLGLEVKGGVLPFLGSIALSAVFCTGLMWIFILLGLAMKTPQAVQGTAMMILMPLQFGSSVFTEPTSMPGWLEAFTKVNPLSTMADASRALIDGEGSALHPTLITLGWVVGLTALTMPLAVAKFRSKT
ncbi:ABC transporter permease [Streptomyces sioyaensis]|uniref:Transport permease protein n=1 Tax=Streptomyces sioyaensis TaxID=67364 RepID=A0A4Q1QW77_9ACTN|nr:ABC transporter permease [Streptomyces sioyaensis]MBM4796496.1 ABC transporter permease [Streptomyces sioyaensis]RXS64031.1 ABC transporter permease [Streptomyces sioyaensis]